MSEKRKIQESLSERSHGAYPTASPVGDGKWAQDVKSHGSVTSAGTDAVDSFDAANNEITAAAHIALAGNTLRFTSGALAGREFSVYSVTTNTIKLAEDLSPAPSAADAFDILAPITQTLSSTGGVSSVNTFLRDGSNQVVTEDTVTPANNRPLPVKLVSTTGDITITADNIDVQLEHTGATPDSVRIGDGTNLAAVSAALDLQTEDSLGNALLTTIDADTSNLDVALSTVATQATLSAMNAKFVTGTDIGDVTVNNAAGAGAVNIQDGGNIISVDDAGSTLSIDDGAGTITVDDGGLTLSVDDGAGSLTVDGTVTIIDGGGSISVDDGGTPLAVSATDLDVRDLTHVSDSVRIGDGTELANVSVANELQVLDSGANTLLGTIDADTSALAGTVSGSELQVDIVAPLPAGTNNIGDVDVASSALPTGAATEATLLTIDADTGSIATDAGTIAGAVSGTEMQVDVVAPLPAGTNTIGNVNLNQLDVVDFLDTPLLDANVSNLPGSAAAPTTFVASLAADVSAIQVFDTTGDFFGIYSDPLSVGPGIALEAIVGPGSNETVPVTIPSGTVLGLRSMTTTAISLGNITMNFLG